MKADEKSIFAEFWFVITPALALVVFGVYCLARCIFADGRVEYCYIESKNVGSFNEGSVLALYGYRPWRSDRMLGVFISADDAKRKADVLDCKMGVR